MVLTDECGATPTTEYSLIAAGLAFGVIVATLPPSMTFGRPTGSLGLVQCHACHCAFEFAPAVSRERQSSDVGGIKRFRSDGGRPPASVENIVASPASNHQIAPD